MGKSQKRFSNFFSFLLRQSKGSGAFLILICPSVCLSVCLSVKIEGGGGRGLSQKRFSNFSSFLA